MDLNTLRDIVEKDEGKIFVFEEGKPLLVLMSFDAYKKLLYRSNKAALKEIEEEELIELKGESRDKQKRKVFKKEPAGREMKEDNKNIENSEAESKNGEDLEIEDLDL